MSLPSVSHPTENSSKVLHHATSSDEFRETLRGAAKFKERSNVTMKDVHLPQLFPPSADQPPPPIDTVLLGDSMFERFKTTGLETKLGQMTYPSLFNCGVGGDKIENVLYRLENGTMDALMDRGVKCWIVMIGTNNLTKRKALGGAAATTNFTTLLQAVRRLNAGIGKIFVCELFERQDIPYSIVQESNAFLGSIITAMNGELALEGRDPISWLPVPAGFSLNMLEDHVHLDKLGYQLWEQSVRSVLPAEA
ncbi:SGNH hydrolase-type esterase domain-containing protein [Amylocarpus encephaloides]|uniref:SGNH hydrolase-type esterase domain-containing protein n=1 Tax=Amylocarpus encephaloides TaxID=45428 RepID=A0A9P8C3P7_9HELO|nr:SGNH hydrolase-type esterase domain-containing protein [Amylocarpus encephaloides]